jgi:ubiquinone/menaquinone biosynthesis C-methylase UbiE
MNPIQQAYNAWAAQYDTNVNLTRDLEAKALKQTLLPLTFSNVLEVGCGTGKNSTWLVQHAQQVLAIDFSEEMLAKAKDKLAGKNIIFQQADITQPWQFTSMRFDLITFCLVLEHIKNLDHIFNEAANKLNSGGYLYVGELHPFKQYQGSVARFDTPAGRVALECYTHNISEFIHAAQKNDFQLQQLNEWFDEDEDAAKVPRILSLLFQKAA